MTSHQTSFLSVVVITLLLISQLQSISPRISPKKLSHDYYTLDLKMPAVQPTRNDEYFCSAVNVTGEELYITQFDPNADATKIHHIIVYGCGDLFSRSNLYPNSWSCAHSILCPGMKIIYAWGRNAPSLTLPKGVGFHVGSRSEVKYLVLQAHYATPLAEKDSSGVSLLYTLNPQPNVAGIFLMAASSGIIPANKPKSRLDVNCVLDRDPIAVFAYRVHAHALGSVISGYRYGSQERSWTALAKGNPQWPQAFYPMSAEVVVARGDLLFARCTFNSTGRDTVTVIGSTAADEMCNLYLMYYSPNLLLEGDGGGYSSRYSKIRGGDGRVQEVCSGVQFTSKEYALPVGNDDPLPRNLTLEESAKGQNSIHSQMKGHSGDHQPINKNKANRKSFLANPNGPLKLRMPDGAVQWPMGATTFGQVTAVDVDSATGSLVIFHRGKHVWNGRSFTMDDKYRLVDEGPIAEETIVTLHPTTQQVLDQWGSGLFYLPHGLTIDNQEGGKKKYLWLTDVALHQVFKFDVTPGSPTYRKAILTLGERFVPGKDMAHFCKPTSVAVESSGDFYVADGYCNSRVMRFNGAGVFQNHWGHPAEYAFGPPPPNPEPNMFLIPHKIVIVPSASSSSLVSSSSSTSGESLACVADRENGRIQCFSLPYGYFKFQIRLEEFNGRLFSVAFSPADRTLYAVAGPSLTEPSKDVVAFAFNVDTQQLRATFAPPSGSFSQPHDMAVSSSGDAVYVVEIGPNNIWKFIQDAASDNPAVSSDDESQQETAKVQSSIQRPVQSVQNSLGVSKSTSSIAVPSVVSTLSTTAATNSSYNPMDFKFNFELLRIRSRQLRNSISFNSMLYFTLFGLFLFIIVLHLRGSSPHYSSLTFFKNLFGAICCCCGRLRKRSSSSTRLANGYDPEPLFGAHSSIAARLELEKLFGGSAKGGKGRGKKNQGFRRLPTNESEVVEDVEDDDDDDEGSDILEDFNPNASLTKNRLV